jgi:hypothetical protein
LLPALALLGEGGSASVASAATPSTVAHATASCAGPDGEGYWEVTSTGQVYAYGAATSYGSITTHLTKPIVGIAPSVDGRGYWLVASDGGVFAFGDAPYEGSTGALHLNAPIVGIAATPDGQGYWLVASDGGVFAFGDAAFYGSTGAIKLNKPVVGIAASKDGRGYWLAASDGGIFNYGDSAFDGSLGALKLNRPKRERLSASRQRRRGVRLRRRQLLRVGHPLPPDSPNRGHHRNVLRQWLHVGLEQRRHLQLR